MTKDLVLILTHASRLQTAVSARRSRMTCLRYWSELIRLRDGNKCVACHQRTGLTAHHICRKAFLPEAQYHTGNGITLCKACHAGVHEGFNGRPDLQQPMDAQGGEKIEVLCSLYSLLAEDARKRHLLRDDLYFLSDSVLAKFKLLQGFDPFTPFPGLRIEQASLIWKQCPLNIRNAILSANGFPTVTEPMRPGLTVRALAMPGT